jgi:hypothetical protein
MMAVSAKAPPRRARDWLRADVREAIRMRVAPARRIASVGGASELDGNLRTWASLLERRRAAVVFRRHLIAALCVTLAAEIVLILLGDDRRGLWLLAPFALALVDAAIAVRRPIRLDAVAQMLDRSLGLSDLLVTARAIVREPSPPAGLRALVVRDAREAAAESFATVRVTTERSQREWAWLLVAVAVLGALALLPGVGGASSARHAAIPALRPPAQTLARARARPTGAAPAARRARAGVTPEPSLGRPPLAVTTGGSRQTSHSGFSPYGHGANSFSARQLAREGIASPSAATKALGALAVGEAGAGASAGGAASSSNASANHAAGGAAAGGASTGSAARGGASPSAGGALAPAGSRTAGAPGAAGTRQAGVGAGAASGGSSPPGGNAAGSAPGSTALKSGLVPVLGSGVSGLPLQAGYAPSGARGSSGSEGVSQAPNGGGRGGRSAHVGGGEGASVSPSLSVIPPTFNATAPLDRGLLSSYFGSANQLTAGNW